MQSLYIKMLTILKCYIVNRLLQLQKSYKHTISLEFEKTKLTIYVSTDTKLEGSLLLS